MTALFTCQIQKNIYIPCTKKKTRVPVICSSIVLEQYEASCDT